MLRSESVAIASRVTWPAPKGQPTVDLFRLRKAVIYADIIEAGNIPAEVVDGFAAGQWAAVALIANSRPPSPESCDLIRKLLHQRETWRALLSREPLKPAA
jgi:hypothetical protein